MRRCEQNKKVAALSARSKNVHDREKRKPDEVLRRISVFRYIANTCFPITVIVCLSNIQELVATAGL